MPLSGAATAFGGTILPTCRHTNSRYRRLARCTCPSKRVHNSCRDTAQLGPYIVVAQAEIQQTLQPKSLRSGHGQLTTKLSHYSPVFAIAKSHRSNGDAQFQFQASFADASSMSLQWSIIFEPFLWLLIDVLHRIVLFSHKLNKRSQSAEHSRH